MHDVEADALTVDQLAKRAGTLSTTVRMYQQRGLLPPPQRRGRVAYYGPHHLDRLRLIDDLQQRGHSLAGIADLLDRWQRGEGLTTVLGVPGLTAPTPARFTVGELIARLEVTEMPADVVQRAVAAGLMQLDGTDVIIPDERFLELGTRLLQLGVPMSVVVDQWQALAADTAAIARRFVDLFEHHVWPTHNADDVVALLGELGSLAHSVTAVALEAALREEAERFAAGRAT